MSLGDNMTIFYEGLTVTGFCCMIHKVQNVSFDRIFAL